MKDFHKRRNATNRIFELALNEEAKKHLTYFIKQELAYYNTLVEGLAPWLRAFPQEFQVFKNSEKNTWVAVAESGIDPVELINTARENWPVSQRTQREMIYEGVVNNNGKCKFTNRQMDILKVVSAPAKIPVMTRGLMATEILKHMQNHATVLENAMKTDTMKNAIQMLQTHSLNTKRHLQVPHAVFHGIMYDENSNSSFIKTPFTKHPLVAKNINLLENKFKMAIIKSPHVHDQNPKWMIELKDFNYYDVTLTDFDTRKPKRR